MKKIILSIMALTALASCQKSEEQTPEMGGSKEVVFTSAISTRVSGTTWEDGDQIGVFMYSAGNTNSENVCYTTSGGDNLTSFTSDTPQYYPEKTNADFVAYHPYITAVSDSQIQLSTTDQSTTEMIKAKDFMVARAQECNAENAPSLMFSRKMSKIVINVIRKESNTTSVLSNISLEGLVVDGTFTVSNNQEIGSVAEGTTIANISLFENEGNKIEAIIIPQEDAQAKLHLLMDGYKFITSFSGTFAENKRYNYNLIIGTDAINLTAGSISDWNVEDSGDISLNKTKFDASEIEVNNIPKSDTWIITNSGEITYKILGGLRSAVNMSGRSISIEFPNATSLGENAFSGCGNLNSINMPKAITIGFNALYNCEDLETINLPEATTIGESAFSGCGNLNSINMPKAITIGFNALYSCEDLEVINLPEATTIGESAFSNCTNLNTINLPKAITIGNSAFVNCTSLEVINLPKATTIENSAFIFCNAIKSIDLSALGTIPNGLFSNFQNLETVILSNAMTIGKSAFSNCTSLETIDLPKAKTIRDHAFYCCTSLETIDISKATTIGESAFVGCTSLEIIDIPNVTTIRDNVFQGCNALKSINCPIVKIIGNNAFEDCAFTSFNFTGVTVIGCSAFGSCDDLSEITNLNATTIEDGAFADSDINTVSTNWTGNDILQYNSNWGFATSATVSIPAGTAADYEAMGWGVHTLVERTE